MKEDDERSGRLVQYCDMPATSGMDAIEARMVLVQEVPPVPELRFFAIRGEKREALSEREAQEILRLHVPRQPVKTLSEVELWVEVSVLRSETDRMRRVYSAVLDWRRHVKLTDTDDRTKALLDVIDEALLKEGP